MRATYQSLSEILLDCGKGFPKGLLKSFQKRLRKCLQRGLRKSLQLGLLWS